MDDPERGQQDFLQRIKATLDAQEAQLDADTVRDLRLARHRALATLQKPRRFWQPVALAGLAAMIVVVVVSLQHSYVKPPGTGTAMENMALLGSGDDFDLYEHLDFYQWLAQEKHNG